MSDFMLDLETLSTSDNACIVAIACVEFDRRSGMVIRTLYRKVAPELGGKIGEIDPGTVIWWLGQSREAQQELLRGNRIPELQAIGDLAFWLSQYATKQSCLWSNGPSFDEVILKSAFHRQQIQWPFGYNAGRDVRTAVEHLRHNGFDYKSIPFVGEKHNALSDAEHQCKIVAAFFNNRRTQ